MNDFSNLYSNLMPKNTVLGTSEKDTGGISYEEFAQYTPEELHTPSRFLGDR